jgi:hypothetical protein
MDILFSHKDHPHRKKLKMYGGERKKQSFKSRDWCPLAQPGVISQNTRT